MTTEQKIIGILQRGYAMTIYEDCGRMILAMVRQRDRWRGAEFYIEDHVPLIDQIDGIIDEAFKWVNDQWIKQNVA